MTLINSHYQQLGGAYLFSEIARRTAAFLQENPAAELIRLGIGDVTRPLSPAVIAALHTATDEMADAATFRGYGPEQGYDFLREAILEHEYRARGVRLEADEIFISDGSKCDVGNIQEIFSGSCIAAIADPVYPVYRDSNLMAGRRIVLMPATAENHFAPALPAGRADLIYLCSPNNPTGAVLTRELLKTYVDHARATGAVILYDSAYSAYIRDPEIPRSIYEIEGAEEVAIEFKSFSKTAGFTGLRCAFTVVPRALVRDGVALHGLWNRRHCTKFNGVAYVVQRAAAAVYSAAGRRETAALIDYYMTNAAIIRDGLARLGHTVYGGENAPYIWWRLAEPDSMKFFDRLLRNCRVIGTPGVGFDQQGEGYFRLTAFGDRERTQEAVARISRL